MNKQLTIPAPGFLSEEPNQNSRFENFLDSIITDEGALTVPFAYEVELTRKTKNTILLSVGILAVGGIMTALILKSKK
jgi:hypothetical protein